MKRYNKKQKGSNHDANEMGPDKENTHTNIRGNVFSYECGGLKAPLLIQDHALIYASKWGSN